MDVFYVSIILNTEEYVCINGNAIIASCIIIKACGNQSNNWEPNFSRP